DKKQRRFFAQFIESPGLVLFLVFFFVIILGLLQGMIAHEPIFAIKDFINYSYLFLIFPLIDIFKKREFVKNVFKMSQAAVISLSILTIIVFILFVTNLAQVHDQFYWWWRSVVVGKATDTGNGFFRIVSSAHLLILPLFLVFLSFLIENKKKFKDKYKKYLIYLSIGASLILLINFSRAYFLGILIGLIFLLKGINWQRWLIFSCLVIFILIAEFGLLFGMVSGGAALQGLGFFKDRLGTIISPNQETSSLTRMTILPVLINKIKQQPIFGQGLGATVEYTDLLTGQDKTTFHLDWGYLEIWVELGLFGLVTYALVLLSIFYQGWQTIKKLKRHVFEKRLVIGLLAGLASLIMASLTGPFLFHPIGIFYLVITAVIIISIKENEFKIDNTNRYLE
ncbi:O-antigen ligase family protein, partial [Patescibacteria group bacterium]|nr:O-antigen ligase family protein [Patescibacteria group bacterium]